MPCICARLASPALAPHNEPAGMPMRWQYSSGITSLVMPISISENGCTVRACRQHAARGRTYQHAALLRRNAAPLAARHGKGGGRRGSYVFRIDASACGVSKGSCLLHRRLHHALPCRCLHHRHRRLHHALAHWRLHHALAHRSSAHRCSAHHRSPAHHWRPIMAHG